MVIFAIIVVFIVYFCNRHQENKLRIQRGLAFTFRPKGNTAGRAQVKRAITVEGEKLPKIQRKSAELSSTALAPHGELPKTI